MTAKRLLAWVVTVVSVVLFVSAAPIIYLWDGLGWLAFPAGIGMALAVTLGVLFIAWASWTVLEELDL